MRYSYLLLVFLSAVSRLTAQTELAIGQWKSHLPFTTGVYVTQSDDRIFYATKYALLAIDKDDRSLERVTKVEGLSQVGVTLVKYNRQSDILVLVYNDGVVDLLRPDGILTLPNIPQSNIITGEKRVNDVFMANDSIAYLATNFGIITLNLKAGIFPNTVKMPVEVLAVSIFQGRIFAATTEGIYFIDPASGENVDDFSNWEWLGGGQGFPAAYSTEAMTIFNEKLYLDVNDSLYVYDGSTASPVQALEGFDLKFLTAEGQHLLAGWQCEAENCNGKVLIFKEDHSYIESGSQCVNVPLYAIEDSNGDIWYADTNRGYRVQSNGEEACENISVNSPYSINIYSLTTSGSDLWVGSGGVSSNFSYLNRIDGFFSLRDGEWDYYNARNIATLSGLGDFLEVAVHPVTGKVYAGSYLDGLIEYDPATGEFQLFNETNSSLLFAEGDAQRTRVAGLAFDRENNLWICNNGAPRPLSVLKNDGTWQNFDLPCTGDNSAFKIAVDAFGYKWIMTAASSTGLIVFDEGDLANLTDDRCRILNTTNTVLPTNEITSLTVDRDGSVWVGTREGALVFQCDPFGDGGCPGSRPFVEVDGFGANLLEDQSVQAIAVDGGNRKWFGTGTGVFVMSPEGNRQIAQFTEKNSPLFDDNVTSIAFNYQTGEVYIGTSQGLISMRSEATAAQDFHSGALVFPNPVREDYDGPIAIQGLAQDATVKITDVAGQLVYETVALGGQAIWYGRDYNGRRVNTGVYLVFATNRNSSNPQVEVAKVLVVN